MKWLLTRLTIIGLIMGILCATAVGAGLLDSTPGKLPQLGFDLCDGQPCFRGIRAGSSWAVMKDKFPQGVERETYDLDSPTTLFDLREIELFASDDHKRVESIQITDQVPFPVSAGDVLMQYGAPCQIELGYVPGTMNLVYPHITAHVNLPMDTSNPHQLQLDVPISGFEIHMLTAPCQQKPMPDSGPWHGFISMEAYQRRNLDDLGTLQLPSTPP